MINADSISLFPAAAAAEIHLPAPQQLIYTPTILVSVILLIIALVVVVYMSRRAHVRGRQEARRSALRTMEKVITRRGGSPDDVDRMFSIFSSHPGCDPAAMIMLKDRFHDELLPLIEKAFDKAFGERMEKLFFPPFKETRHALAIQNQEDEKLVEELKSATAAKTAEAISNLMDAVLRPGVITRLCFEGLEGGHECMIMGYDRSAINVTLPSHSDKFIAALQSGMGIDGTLEHGPSLIGFTASVIQAIAGSMPYCRITPWASAWEIRKRASVRLPAVLDIDFQHISTASEDSINMSNLEKEIGTLRPGRLVDLSHGGCCIETPSSGAFHTGDMIRFSRMLAPGDPPATFLGAIVNIDTLDPDQNTGSLQRLHVQFLIIDDVSQRILVRALRQLQNERERDEWIKAQQLLQKIRKHNIENIGSPVPMVVSPRRSGSTTSVSGKMSARTSARSAPGQSGTGQRPR